MCFAFIGLFLIPVIAVFSLVAFAFWIWMLVDAIQNHALSEGEKVAWVLAIVFLHIIGAILYLVIGHPKKTNPVPPASGGLPPVSP